MAILDVVGPVMVGPSSSHTLGALRIARFAYIFAGGVPDEVRFILHGSFAETHMGHGTDKALLAGIMGMLPDDENIKRAHEIAKERGLKYEILDGDLGEVHPNTVLIEMKRGERECSIMGSSIGAGEIRIVRINDVECNIGWEYNTIVIAMMDVKGSLAEVLKSITKNIANLYMRRVNAMENRAVGIIELDEDLPPEDLERLRKNRYVFEAYYIPRD